MIILTLITDVIRVVTTSANAVDVHCSFVDNQTATATPYTPGRQNTAIAAAATTTILGAPSTATQRQVKKIMICARGGANTVTVEFFDGTTAFRQLQVALGTGEQLEYEDLCGWMVRAADGSIKTTGVGLGRFTGFQILTAGTVYTPTAGTTSQIVEGIAGGGGGGGVAASTAGQITVGAGGGSGGYFKRRYTITGGATGTYAIGAAGAAGANTGAVAGTGGNTTFTDGTTLCTAFGGVGAPAMLASGTSAVWNIGGAAGAISTNGQVNQGGEQGEPSNRVVNTGLANQAYAGGGGTGFWGGGGVSRITSGAGANAIANSGAGGGGALSLNAAAAAIGGAGGAGIIIVWEFA